MARRTGLVAAASRISREADRQRAAQIRANAAAQREAMRARAAYERASAADAKERKRLYEESRAAEATALTDAGDEALDILSTLLAATLSVDDHIDFDSLKQPAILPTWGRSDLETSSVPPVWAQFAPPEPAGAAKVFGKAKHEQAIAAARTAFELAQREDAAREAARVAEWTRVRGLFDEAVRAAHAKAAAQHTEVDAFRAEFEAGEPDAVVSYFDLVLQRSTYPEGFPQGFRIAFVPGSRQLVIEYELPGAAIVPAVKLYKYVKASDSITETARPLAQIRAAYASVVAQVTLRTIHEVFEADRGRNVDTVVFNGVVDTIDPGSGKNIRPCVVTVRTTRDVFAELDLARVDPLACLKHLSAAVSASPAELTPVRPVLEFNMVDARFVAETDALSGLDQRPNLMELTPTEFEALIQNLFTKMGLEAKQTRPSRDGGVDCVAYDPRPIFGGKVVIQAKRYKNTVGVSAVRDLFGTLQNEGASKGILVTTSGYGQASFDFAKNKPIELIDGANLLYLLAEHAQIEAKILPPEDWHDPAVDVPGL